MTQADNQPYDKSVEEWLDRHGKKVAWGWITSLVVGLQVWAIKDGQGWLPLVVVGLLILFVGTIAALAVVCGDDRITRL